MYLQKKKVLYQFSSTQYLFSLGLIDAVWKCPNNINWFNAYFNFLSTSISYKAVGTYVNSDDNISMQTDMRTLRSALAHFFFCSIKKIRTLGIYLLLNKSCKIFSLKYLRIEY